MIRTEHYRLFSFLIGSSGYLVPYCYNEDCLLYTSDAADE